VHLYFTFCIGILSRRDYSGFRIQSIIGIMRDRGFTFAFLSAKSWRALTRVFLESGRGLIAIDELVIFFDPSIPMSALSYGEEATAASTVESPSFFFLSFHRGPSLVESLRIVERSSFRARRRPRDLMPRGHVGASSILLLLRPFPHFFLIRRQFFLSCSTFSSALTSGMRIRGRHVLSG